MCPNSRKGDVYTYWKKRYISITELFVHCWSTTLVLLPLDIRISFVNVDTLLSHVHLRHFSLFFFQREHWAKIHNQLSKWLLAQKCLLSSCSTLKVRYILIFLRRTLAYTVLCLSFYKFFTSRCRFLTCQNTLPIHISRNKYQTNRTKREP